MGSVLGWSRVRSKVALVLMLALLRAVLHSERLAILELVVPALVTCLAWRTYRPGHSTTGKRLIQAGPFLAVPALIFVFGAFEYSRSWTGFYANRQSSFVSFVGLRLVGYYSTALNNGALILDSLRQPFGTPLFTLNFAWKFPILGEITSRIFPDPGFSLDTYMHILESSANPEFNNPSGLLLPFADFGVAGGLLYWLLSGILCGYLYRRFLAGAAAGLFLYPALFTGLIEASRILYWSDGRFFPGMFLLIVSVAVLF